MESILIKLFCIALFSQNLFSQTEISIGEAKNKSGKVIYLEKHMSTFKNQELIELQTTYYTKQKKKFGFLHSKFANNPYIPDHQFADTRFGRRDSLKQTEGSFTVIWKQNQNSPESQFSVTPPKTAISGQGFHNFLRKNLNRFLKNPKLKLRVQFFVPIKKNSYSFRILLLNINKQKQTMHLRFEASSWFFRLIAPHIEVIYNYKSKQLLMYSGPSNLKTATGDDENVVINYTYPSKQQLKEFNL